MSERSWNNLSTSSLHRILSSLYYFGVQTLATTDTHPHYCSLEFPCSSPIFQVFRATYTFRLVSSDWNSSFVSFKQLDQCRFFQRVEDVYYPNPRHINAKIRSSVLLGRYRLFKTIDTEDGDRGVFEALDYRSSTLGCRGGTQVIIKAWSDPNDSECQMESLIYEILKSNEIDGIPTLHANTYDRKCGVHALVLEKLGPSLQDLLRLTPSKKFDRKMLLALAIQMITRYEAIHRTGIIHNGVKPGNICLSCSPKLTSKLNIIDFGLSYINKAAGENAPMHQLSETRNAVVGNRQFLSVFGHLGIAQSQRDDLESLGYLFSFLHHGHLPWSLNTTRPSDRFTKSTSRSGSSSDIWRTKMSIPCSVLFEDMDPAFVLFWKDVKSLSFGERPDYTRLRSYFVASWERDGVPEPVGEYHWIGHYERLKETQEERVVRN